MGTPFSDIMYYLPIYILICSQWTVTCFDKFGAPLLASTNKSTKLNETARVGDLSGIIKRYHPQLKNLKGKRLLRRLRNHFEEDWMSITRPAPTYETVGPEIQSNNASFAETYKQVRDMLSRNDKLKMIFNLEVEPLAQFLTGLSTCKVRYEWSDLGGLFWPRYVKTGLCTSTESCSWPSGMTCVPGRLKAIIILRWRCRRRKSVNWKRNSRKSKRHESGEGTQLVCSWKRIPYHVPVDCACSC